ncbi:MAG: hypothetical protein JWQ72_2444, partial [Polaromonas sp.]|nr:hypothetical protein [Polaromonas sp.]
MGMASLSPYLLRSPGLALVFAPLQAVLALFMPPQSASAAPQVVGNGSAQRRPGQRHTLEHAPWRLRNTHQAATQVVSLARPV